jgi:hypothetical protein
VKFGGEFGYLNKAHVANDDGPVLWLIIHLIQLVFLAGTVFFSHKKLANSVFQPGYNSSRTAPMMHRIAFKRILQANQTRPARYHHGSRERTTPTDRSIDGISIDLVPVVIISYHIISYHIYPCARTGRTRTRTTTRSARHMNCFSSDEPTWS